MEQKLYEGVLPFTKMHGAGNDYIYVNCMERTVAAPEKLAQRLSDRHFGIGGDGLVLICPSAVADARMRMFNADGSEGKMCGNATRCIGKYLYDKGIVPREQLTLETLSGIKTLRLDVRQGRVESVSVSMGAAEFDGEKIPVQGLGAYPVNVPLTVGETEYTVSCVSMGNPHCVVFTQEDTETLELPKIGPGFELHPAFPERVNTEFVNTLGENCFRMRVWERGSGETLACGTGACAVAAAAVATGRANYGEELCIRLRGGELYITVTKEDVIMRGAAQFVFEGTVEL